MVEVTGLDDDGVALTDGGDVTGAIVRVNSSVVIV